MKRERRCWVFLPSRLGYDRGRSEAKGSQLTQRHAASIAFRTRSHLPPAGVAIPQIASV
jgi:hypothetical protein